MTLITGNKLYNMYDNVQTFIEFTAYLNNQYSGWVKL